MYIFPLQTDPFNRSHLTQDMLIPDTELKSRIEEFIRSQRSKKRTAADSEMGEPDGAADMADWIDGAREGKDEHFFCGTDDLYDIYRSDAGSPAFAYSNSL